jgi:hypothetical protein
MQSMSRDPSDPMTNRGRQSPEYGGNDEKAALEHLALEGVEEAQHEQMLASRKNVDEPLRSLPKKEGDYDYLCTSPGHWEMMWGTLVVTRDVDAYLQSHPDAPQQPDGAHDHAAHGK